MSRKGLTRSEGRFALGKYVETKKPLPTQWKVVLRWMPSTLRARESAPTWGRGRSIEVVVFMPFNVAGAGPRETAGRVMPPITPGDWAPRRGRPRGGRAHRGAPAPTG